MYTLKQFAAMFHATQHTIRYYTDIGLLPAGGTGPTRRIFDEESVNWMQGIVCLKGCGASIEDIKEILRIVPPAAVQRNALRKVSNYPSPAGTGAPARRGSAGDGSVYG